MIMNFASAIVFANLGLFLRNTFKSDSKDMGEFEAVVIFISYAVRLLSGTLSDYFRNRKILIVIGCVMIAASNFMLAHSAVILSALIARCFGRIGHGIQSVTRAALISDITTKDSKGAAYGISRSLGVIGSLIGVLVVYFVLKNCPSRLVSRSLFSSMAIPPLVAAAIVLLLINEKKADTYHSAHKLKPRRQFSFANIRRLSGKFWTFMIVVAIIAVTQISELLIMTEVIRRFHRPDYDVNLIASIVNLSSVIFSYYLGVLSDKIGKYYVLLFAVTLKCITQYCIGCASSYMFLLVSMFLCGIQVVAMQNVPESIVADLSHKECRGTAFGIYYFVIALSSSFASRAFGRLVEQKQFSETMKIFSFISLLATVIVLVLCIFGFAKRKINNEKKCNT